MDTIRTAPAALYIFGFLLDPFSLDLQRVVGVAGVHSPKHISPGFVQRDLGRLQLELCLLNLDCSYDRFSFSTGRRFGLVPAAAGTTAGQDPQKEQTEDPTGHDYLEP